MTAFPPQESKTPSQQGRGRSVLLVVTGGIAAYKACLVLRGLQDAGCTVRVVMTESATHFVTAMTFEALSGQPVGTTLWGDGGEAPLDHIQWAREADVIVVAPATANFLAKMSHGLADDLPSTLVAAAHSPVLAAPAMNDHMWLNPANQENLSRLRERGIGIVEPGTGWLACGTVAEGRLAEPEEIVSAVLEVFEPGPLAKKKILITAGPTYEAVDAVRYLGNRSSGRMGIALASAARDRGADVTLLLGPSELSPPDGVVVQRFESAAELGSLTEASAPTSDVVIMSAAVADFRPASPELGKRKKADGVPELRLTATEDILAGLGASKPAGQLLVGFALESGGDKTVETESVRKLADKGLDLIVGNRADRDGEGFSSSDNRIFIAERNGTGRWLPPASKVELAGQIIERIVALLEGGTPGQGEIARA